MINSIEMIDITKIRPQNKIFNRIENDTFSTELLSLMNKIRNHGLIHPIHVRKISDDFYELFIGYRRFRAFEMLAHENDDFKRIPASVCAGETKDKHMFEMTIAENKERKALTRMEDIETNLSFIPLLFPGITFTNKEYNFRLGFNILKKWVSYVRSDYKSDKYLKELKEITKSDNPASNMHEFFKAIGIKERTFFDQASVFMDSPLDIVILLRNRKLSIRHAQDIKRLQSHKAQKYIIKKIEAADRMKYKDIEKLIKDVKLQTVTDHQKKNLLIRYRKLEKPLEKAVKHGISNKKVEHINTIFNLIEESLGHEPTRSSEPNFILVEEPK